MDKSLVQTVHTHGEVRYQLLEPLLQYAAARNTADEAGDSKGRHAGYFRDLAEQAAPELRGPRQLEWLERLELEHDNLRAAMAWGLEAGDAELAQRTAAALTWFWIVRRYVDESVTWFDRVLAIEGGSQKARGSALVQGGFISTMVRLGDLEGCLALIREAQALFVELGDEQGVKTAQNYEAVLLWWQRDLEASRPRAAGSLRSRRPTRPMGLSGRCVLRLVFGFHRVACGRQITGRRALQPRLGDLPSRRRPHFYSLDAAPASKHFTKLRQSGPGYRALRSEPPHDERLEGPSQCGCRIVGTRDSSASPRRDRRGSATPWGGTNTFSGGRRRPRTILADFERSGRHPHPRCARGRYSPVLDLAPSEWTRMVLADGEAWRSRPGTTP